MYNGKSERAAFSDRLVSTLTALGWTKMSPTGLAKQFNVRAGPTDTVSIHGARKWLTGGAIPTQERLKVLASWLEVQPDWLRFGKTLRAEEDEIFASADLDLLRDLAELDSASKRLVRDVIAVMLKAGKPRKSELQFRSK